jgi:hypothetical protein
MASAVEEVVRVLASAKDADDGPSDTSSSASASV